jgi:hypothetical protein
MWVPKASSSRTHSSHTSLPYSLLQSMHLLKASSSYIHSSHTCLSFSPLQSMRLSHILLSHTPYYSLCTSQRPLPLSRRHFCNSFPLTLYVLSKMTDVCTYSLILTPLFQTLMNVNHHHCRVRMAVFA